MGHLADNTKLSPKVVVPVYTAISSPEVTACSPRSPHWMLESFVIVLRSSCVKWYLLQQKCQGGAQQSALSRALLVI